MLCLYLKDRWYFSVNDVRKKQTLRPCEKRAFLKGEKKRNQNCVGDGQCLPTAAFAGRSVLAWLVSWHGLLQPTFPHPDMVFGIVCRVLNKPNPGIA